MTKTLNIKKKTLKAFFLSMLIGGMILYVLEHFGQFSYVAAQKSYLNTKPSFVTYNSLDTELTSIFYQSFFGNQIRTNGNGYNIADINYSDTSFDKYSVKSYYYTQATIRDYKYGIYFGLILFALIMFFTHVKIKIS